MDNLEVVDVKMDAADDQSVSEDYQVYWININDQKHKVEKSVVTPEDVARIAKMDPKEVCVYVHIEGEKPRLLQPDEKVDLSLPGIEQFQVDKKYSVKLKVNTTTFRLAVPTTGERVKQAAIEAGASIELDFVLFLESANGPPAQIDDDKMMFFDEDTCFVAVAADDNS